MQKENQLLQNQKIDQDGDEFALNLMITKALDKDGKRLFQDGHKASLRREVNAGFSYKIYNLQC